MNDICRWSSTRFRYTITLQKSKGWAARVINIRKKLRILGFDIDEYDDSPKQLWMYVSHQNNAAITQFLLENKYDIVVEEE